MVEDSEDDAILIVSELKRGGYKPVYERVETKEDMSAALGRQTWDVILADYKMPRFSGREALDYVKELGLGMPFLLVSGAIGEDIAVQAMKDGAHDYVMKDRLARLVPAVERALCDENARRERRRAEEALKNEAAVSAALLEAYNVTSSYIIWDEIVERVLGLLPKLISSGGAAIIMLDDEGWLLLQKAVGDLAGLNSLFNSMRPRAEELLAVERLLNTKKPLSVQRQELDLYIPHYFKDSMGLSEIIITPIIAREKVTGFLWVNFDRLPTDPRVATIIQGIAGQLGSAYENARLYEETQQKSLDLARKVEALKVLSEIDRVILSTLNREEMLSRAVQQISRLLPAVGGAAFLVDPEHDCLRFSGGWGITMENGAVVQRESCAGLTTLKSGKTLSRTSLTDIKQLSSLDRAFIATGVKSDMYIPIISKGKGLGLVWLGSSRVAGFSLEDAETAKRLAAQIGIALENTRLVSDLEEMFMNIIKALASAIDAKSPWTKGHSERVTEYAEKTAKKMGFGHADTERLRLAGLLHDIGKIGTYDVILDKPDKLTEAEFELVKKHPDKGCEILSPIKQFKDLLPIIRHHHERWDGKGYPAGLKGEEIPLLARILCAADSFDSMTADRPYRPAPGMDYAISEFNRCRGTQYDPAVVDAFLAIMKEAPAIAA